MEMKRTFVSIAAALLMILIFTQCMFENPQNNVVIIDKELIADRLGNSNEILEEGELALVDSFFQVNDHAYALGPGFFAYENAIPADTLRKHLFFWSEIFASEQDLRDHYEGIGIKTPWVVIYKMAYDANVYVNTYYRAPGPNVYGGEWEELEIY